MNGPTNMTLHVRDNAKTRRRRRYSYVTLRFAIVLLSRAFSISTSIVRRPFSSARAPAGLSSALFLPRSFRRNTERARNYSGQRARLLHRSTVEAPLAWLSFTSSSSPLFRDSLVEYFEALIPAFTGILIYTDTSTLQRNTFTTRSTRKPPPLSSSSKCSSSTKWNEW